MAKTPINQFEDELGELVDRYLLEGLVGAADIKSVLRHEAEYNYVERMTELLAGKRATSSLPSKDRE